MTLRIGGMRKVAVVAVLGASCALMGSRYLSSRAAIAAVPAELRSPLMFLPFPSTTRMLPLIRQVFRLSLPPGAGVKVTRHRVDGIPVQMTTPAVGGYRRPAVLWIHGGGTVIGSPQFESPTIGHLARELNAVVVSPDYRLAPEYPFPAPLDDCMATLWWMRDNADELGIDADRIAVAGASAGGGLTAAVAQRSHDEGIALRAQVIIYGMLDDRVALVTDHERRGQFVVSPAAYRFAWTSYLGREPRMSDAPNYAAPARRTDLVGLPPAWVGAGDLDVMYPENVTYAERLRECGVPCELVTVPGMYHGADGLAPKADSMKEFRRSIVNYLRAHL
jgi:acetyl esterase/lipase